jgi:N-acetylmuramoyl-L-alanine amidase
MLRRRTALFALSLVWLPRMAQAGPRPVVERPYVVAIDPGHGGDNTGCQSADGHAHEKDVTLRLAQELEAKLRIRLPHARLVLTRHGDETVTLAERVAIANEARADLFLSLHANASPGRSQTGFESYVLEARATGREAARTAQRENAGGTEAGTARDAAGFVAELSALANRERAARFALAIQRAQAERFPARLDRGVKQGPFDVLMGARMPAVLFEAGFLDHPDEGAMLGEGEQLERIADGLAEAIVAQYREGGRL